MQENTKEYTRKLLFHNLHLGFIKTFNFNTLFEIFLIISNKNTVI